MWFRTIFRNNRAPRPNATPAYQPPALLDEAFVRRIERLSVQANRQLQGSPAGGEHPSNRRVPGAIFSEHRPYAHGDDYRTIDWNAYARQGEMVVKLGETEQAVDVHILLDTSRSMIYGQPVKLAASQQLAAALGFITLANNDRLHITPFSTAPLPSYGPVQGKAHAPAMLRYLSGVRPAASTDIAMSLREYTRRQERGGILVLLSDMLSGTVDALDQALRHVPPPRWQTVVLHMLDAQELTPPPLGAVDIADAETGAVQSVEIDAQALAQYRANLDRWQRGISAACTSRNITYAQLLTNWPLERAVLPYLAKRRVIR